MWPSGNGESPEKHQTQEHITACLFFKSAEKYKHLSHCSVLCLLSISGLLLRYWCNK